MQFSIIDRSVVNAQDAERTFDGPRSPTAGGRDSGFIRDTAELTLRALSNKGTIVIFPSMIPLDDNRDSTGYLGWWRDDIGQVWVYDRLIIDEDDAVLAMHRLGKQFSDDAVKLMANFPDLGKKVAKIEGFTGRGDHWVPAMRDTILRIMGFDASALGPELATDVNVSGVSTGPGGCPIPVASAEDHAPRIEVLGAAELWAPLRQVGIRSPREMIITAVVSTGTGKCGGGGGCTGCCGTPCCGNPDPCCGSTNPCCGDPDPCCGSGDPCCGNPCCSGTDPCCGSTDPCCDDPCCGNRCCRGEPCCGNSDPCCDSNDRCCGDPNRCCNSDNPCCGSTDPCCNSSDICCGDPDPCCNPDNPCCGNSNPCDPLCGNPCLCDPCICNRCLCMNCDDGDVCTIDGCSAGSCWHEPKCDGEQCCPGTAVCCPDGQECCGETGCCPSGQHCCADGVTCCPTSATASGADSCCGHACCADGYICCNEECVQPGCSVSLSSASGAPCQTIELTLTGSCRPGCNSMTFDVHARYPTPYSLIMQPWLDISIPEPINCADGNQTRTVSVYIHGDAPPSDVIIDVSGSANGQSCGASGTLTINRTYTPVTLEYKTFISCGYIQTGYPSPVWPFFSGDGRVFNAPGTSRTQQSIVMKLDPIYSVGEVGPPVQSSGISNGYISLLETPPPYADWCSILCRFYAGPNQQPNCSGPGSSGWETLPERIDNNNVKVRFHLFATAGCSGPGTPSIDSDLTVYLKQECEGNTLGPLEMRFDGFMDGFPWHELIVNGGVYPIVDPCQIMSNGYWLLPPDNDLNVSISWQPVLIP
ncbi:MAG: hypothetical protein HYR83_05575 [Planctomycetes bacterium]|nr:hypothetical protein [Planctomycetota bacterium]